MPPVVSQPIPDAFWRPTGYFLLQIPPSTFSDPDSSLTYSATLGDGAQLPDLLTFNPATLTFEGTPPRVNNVLSFTLQVTASDGEFVASDTFAVSAWGGWDVVFSLGPQNDTIAWGDGGFIILADGGDDTLIGGRGNDGFNGGDGNDLIDGGGGHDVLTG
jgi:Ca2+-binding RTX toxin-like protein